MSKIYWNLTADLRAGPKTRALLKGDGASRSLDEAVAALGAIVGEKARDWYAYAASSFAIARRRRCYGRPDVSLIAMWQFATERGANAAKKRLDDLGFAKKLTCTVRTSDLRMPR